MIPPAGVTLYPGFEATWETRHETITRAFEIFSTRDPVTHLRAPVGRWSRICEALSTRHPCRRGTLSRRNCRRSAVPSEHAEKIFALVVGTPRRQDVRRTYETLRALLGAGAVPSKRRRR